MGYAQAKVRDLMPFLSITDLFLARNRAQSVYSRFIDPAEQVL